MLNNSLGQQWQKLSRRERWVAVSTLVVSLAMLWFTWVWEPVTQQREGLLSNQRSLADDIKARELEIAALQQGLTQDVDAPARAENDRLREALSAYRERLNTQLDTLVPAEEILGMLSVALNSSDGMRLIQAQKSPSEQALKADEPQGDALLFKHRFRLLLRGDYEDALRYLRHLEKSLPKLRLVGMDYRVVNYPEAEITLDVETLGLDEQWLKL